jgi:hypothetical protein
MNRPGGYERSCYLPCCSSDAVGDDVGCMPVQGGAGPVVAHVVRGSARSRQLCCHDHVVRPAAQDRAACRRVRVSVLPRRRSWLRNRYPNRRANGEQAHSALFADQPQLIGMPVLLLPRRRVKLHTRRSPDTDDTPEHSPLLVVLSEERHGGPKVRILDPLARCGLAVG